MRKTLLLADCLMNGFAETALGHNTRRKMKGQITFGASVGTDHRESTAQNRHAPLISACITPGTISPAASTRGLLARH